MGVNKDNMHHILNFLYYFNYKPTYERINNYIFEFSEKCRRMIFAVPELQILSETLVPVFLFNFDIQKDLHVYIWYVGVKLLNKSLKAPCISTCIIAHK